MATVACVPATVVIHLTNIGGMAECLPYADASLA